MAPEHTAAKPPPSVTDVLRPLLAGLGYTLADKQVHIGGERRLFSEGKFVLMAVEAATGRRVVIKASNDPAQIREIEHERACRRILSQIDFAYHVFHSPAELRFLTRQGFAVFVTAFIRQDMPFLDRPLTEQFFLALKAFEALEGVHATTFEHAGLIRRAFGSMNGGDYVRRFDDFRSGIDPRLAPAHRLRALLPEARSFLSAGRTTIDRYAGFLTHWDFVPHNIRVNERRIYLLDHAALRFGNKYESWARFVNFMMLYHPALESALLRYVDDNRGAAELRSLKLMRVFRLGELIRFYAGTLDSAQGDLRTLNAARIDFWTAVLDRVLRDEPVPDATINAYRQTRDALRSEDEKERQQGLH